MKIRTDFVTIQAVVSSSKTWEILMLVSMKER